jgi:Asp-tRNA(Asn)/Glu-tRNA(Gln) amidotransferase A subunit family amidase
MELRRERPLGVHFSGRHGHDRTLLELAFKLRCVLATGPRPSCEDL